MNDCQRGCGMSQVVSGGKLNCNFPDAKTLTRGHIILQLHIQSQQTRDSNVLYLEETSSDVLDEASGWRKKLYDVTS